MGSLASPTRTAARPRVSRSATGTSSLPTGSGSGSRPRSTPSRPGSSGRRPRATLGPRESRRGAAKEGCGSRDDEMCPPLSFISLRGTVGLPCHGIQAVASLGEAGTSSPRIEPAGVRPRTTCYKRPPAQSSAAAYRDWRSLARQQSRSRPCAGAAPRIRQSRERRVIAHRAAATDRARSCALA